MRRVLPALVVAALVAAGVAAGRGPGPRAPAAAGAGARVSAVSGLERQTLAAINAVCRVRGLVPLRLNRWLAAAARRHSASMAEHGFFGHASYGGSAFGSRIRPAYPPLPGHGWSAGENLVWASPELSARMVVDLWLRSPEHRRKLLAPAWREVGVGGVHALAAPGVYRGLDVTIVTADFGVR